MCFDNDGHAEFYRESTVRVRKRRRCQDCNRPIEVGQFAKHSAGKFDGDMFSIYVCARCNLLRHMIHKVELHEGCSWSESWCPVGELQEYLMEVPVGDDGDIEYDELVARGESVVREKFLEATHAVLTA